MISLSSLTLCNTSSFLTWSVQLIFSILLRRYISKLSRHFWATFQSVQVSHHTVLCSKWCYICIIKNHIFVEYFSFYYCNDSRLVLSPYLMTANLYGNRVLKYVWLLLLSWCKTWQPIRLYIQLFISWQQTRTRHVKFHKEIDYQSTYKFIVNYIYVLTMVTVAMEQNFEVVLRAFNVVRICITGNYAQKWIIDFSSQSALTWSYRAAAGSRHFNLFPKFGFNSKRYYMNICLNVLACLLMTSGSLQNLMSCITFLSFLTSSSNSSSSSSSSSKDKRGVPWRTLATLRSLLFRCFLTN
jgi:hypothetical protein